MKNISSKSISKDLLKKGLAAAFVIMFSSSVFAAPAPIEKTIIDGIQKGSKSIDVSAYKLDPQKAMETYMTVITDNPDLFYADAMVNCTYDKKSNICTSLVVKYNAADIAARKKKFDTAIAAATKDAQTKKTQYEQAKAVHDYMVKTFSFDSSGENATAYDIAVNKKGTCIAYTGFYKAAMDKLGIPCKVAISKDMQHEWNIVQIDGKWYHADITYDDPVGSTEVVYSNFLKNDKMAGITGHFNWTVTGNIKCTDKTYNIIA